MWSHTVQLSQDTIRKIQDSVADRLVKTREDRRVILARWISGKRQFDTEQEAIASLGPFVNVQHDSSGTRVVSRKVSISSRTPDAPENRTDTFNPSIEKHDPLLFWLIVATIEG